MSRTKLYRVRKEDNFTRVHNEVLRRSDISWKAKGILVYILSLPDDWTIYLEEIVKHSTDGMTSFRAGWKELKDKGYVKRVPVREGGKIVRWDTYINETVDTTASVLLVGNPQVENQQVENLNVENDKLLTTNNTNDLDIQTTNNILSGNPTPPYKEVMEYLNEKADKRFKYQTEAHKKFIKARFNEGNTVDDFKRVIDNKVAQWKGDPKWDEYLRPKTLFGTNFESYLNQKDVGQNKVREVADF